MYKKLIVLLISLSLCASLLIPSFSYTPNSEKIVFTEDFEYATIAEAKAEIEKYSYFELGSYLTKEDSLKKEGDNTYLHMTWSEGRLLRGKTGSPLELRSNYTLSLDTRATKTSQDGGWIFVRTSTSPFVTHEKKVINEYETDSFNDGKYPNGVGATGVYIKPHGTKIQIGIRTTEPVSETNKNGIGRKYVELDAPNGKDVGTTFFALRVEDYNDVMKIYADDVLLVSIEYSNTNGSVFTKAVMKDAEGTVLIDIDNARIAHKAATIAFANRAGSIDVDNIVLEKDVPQVYRRKLHKDDKSSAVRCETDMAFQFTATEKFEELIVAAPNYSNNIGNLTLSLYKWNESYEKTLAQEPITSFEHVNYPDSNPGLSLDCPVQDAGQYLLYIENTSEDPDELVGIWAASAMEGVQMYVNGVANMDLSVRVDKIYVSEPEKDFGDISKVYAISVDENITNGTIEVQSTAYDGEKVTVTVKPDASMQLKALKVNGEDVSGNEFVMPKADVAISAEFEEVQNPPTGDTSVMPILLVAFLGLLVLLKKKVYA